MDENLRDVLTTLIQVVGGFLTGVVVAVAGFRFTRDREDRQREREDLARRRDRWMTERRETYARYLRVLTVILDRAIEVGAGADEKPYVEAMMEGNHLYFEVALLASEPVRVAATEAWSTTAERAAQISGIGGDPAGAAVTDQQRDRAAGLFLVRAREELHPD